MTKRKFFTGNSVRAALIAAASHFDIPADEIAYREVDKKHGFLKLRKKVIIEVDGDDPRNPPVFVEPESSHTAAAAGGRGRGRGGRGKKAAAPAPPPMIDVEDDEDAPDYDDGDDGDAGDDSAEEAAPGPPVRSSSGVATPARGRGRGRGDDGRDARETQSRGRGGQRGPQRGSQRGSQRGQGDDGGGRGRGRGGRGDEAKTEAPPAAAPPAKKEPPREEPGGGEAKTGGGRRRGRGRGRGKQGDSLVELPDRSRSRSERYEEASGEIADACRESLDRILGVAGVEMEYKVFQDGDRLEVELFGDDEELMVAEDGELLLAVEHLLPRAMRGLCGEGVQVRVDCADFHEVHEERLRSLAQKVANEVRRNGKPKKLEPLNPADRRIVHLTLTDEPDVTSASEGRGHFKRIVVRPD